jgi:hypothetical protein
MPIEESGLMAAVDAGLAEASAAPAPTTPEPTNEPTDTTDAHVDPASAGTAGDQAGNEGAEGHDEGAAGDADVPETGGAAATPGIKPVTDADGKSPDGAPATPEVKAPDPLNDPLPNALKRETKERITTLVGMVKEKDQALQRVETEHREIMGAILDTKANPEQYGQALEYLRMVNSPSRADQEQALSFLQMELAAMARRLGKQVPGVNMLEGHNDLIEEVSTGRLSPDRAQEIAAARAAAQEAQRIGQRQHQSAQETQRIQQEVARGKADLSALGKQLQAANPAVYEAKRKILVNTLKPVFATIPPSQWAATFKRAYDALPAPVAPTVAPPTPLSKPGVPAGGGGNTPLRASNPAGSAAPAPKSLAEAIELGISQAR